jgi:hypothetical protein
MAMAEDDTFIALGNPNLPGMAGFVCNSADLGWGGWMMGFWGGLYAQANNPGPNVGDPPDRNTTLQPGVFGTSRDGPGVVGTSRVSSGVYGQNGDLEAPRAGVPAGVVGAAQLAMGVYGSSSGNRGVFGESESSFGVQGASQQSIGVVGWSAQAGPDFAGRRIAPAGVFGTSQNNPGIIGTSAQSFGVAGQSGQAASLTFNAGVFGTSAASIGVAGTSANSVGVFAASANFNGVFAVSGQAGPISGLPLPFPAAVFGTSAKGLGVLGTSANSDGIAGLSAAPPAPGRPPSENPAGVRGDSTNGGIGVLGVTRSTPTSPGAGVAGVCNGNGFGVLGYNPTGYAGYFIGNVHIQGQINAPIKNAVVAFPDGSQRLLHSMESPDHWFEDFGSARLNRGRAMVKLDADFGKVVTLDGYRVFLTPEGDCKGLYVRSKRGASFEVRELQGGTSNVAFSYRIVAKRKDVKRHTRFARIDAPVVPLSVGKARAARGRKPARLPSSVRALFATLEKESRKQAT